MGVLNINDLKEGMVLAVDVKNRHEQLLLKKGAELTTKDILILKTWGINEADVEGIDQVEVEKQEMQSLSPSIIDALEGELTELFHECDDNPVMAEIRRIVRKFKLKHALTEMKRDEKSQHREDNRFNR
jgi:hypothetical protein